MKPNLNTVLAISAIPVAAIITLLALSSVGQSNAIAQGQMTNGSGSNNATTTNYNQSETTNNYNSSANQYELPALLNPNGPNAPPMSVKISNGIVEAFDPHPAMTYNNAYVSFTGIINGTKHVFIVSSNDRGKTFKDPIDLSKGLANSSSSDVVAFDKNVFVAFLAASNNSSNNSNTTIHKDLYISFSPNEGKTFKIYNISNLNNTNTILEFRMVINYNDAGIAYTVAPLGYDPYGRGGKDPKVSTYFYNFWQW